MRATRTFMDKSGIKRKNGEEWLIKMEDTEAHIPDVYEEVGGHGLSLITFPFSDQLVQSTLASSFFFPSSLPFLLYPPLSFLPSFLLLLFPSFLPPSSSPSLPSSSPSLPSPLPRWLVW